MAAFWFFIVLPILLFVVAESQYTSQLNQTDMEAAIADMRAKSYHGFVILLKILERSPNPLQGSEITFLMPSDERLSDPELNLDHIQSFVLTHSIPSPLVYNSMLRFPSGTLVPSGLQGKMLSITHSHGLFLNNARIVEPNVCVHSTIKCHGISSAISFDNGNAPPFLPPPTTIGNAPPPLPPPTTIANDPQAAGSMDSQKTHPRAKPSPSIHLERNSPET